MKKVVRACLALMLGILMTVNVYADSGMAQYPDYVTDYYMVVESPDGGIDFYAGASFDSSKLNEELIPNGTAFRIEGEVTDANKRVWGYSKYHGMTGYICEDDCRMVTRSEAIKSELGIAQTAEADYDYVAAGEKILYNGPGEKFGKVSGSIAIPKGTTVHIEKEAKLADGSDWGYTTYQYEGWIELESLVNIEEEAIEENNTEAASVQESATDVVNLENTNESTTEADQNAAETEQEFAENAAVENETVAALNEENGDAKEQKAVKVTSTPTPEPTATSTPTPKPTATNTPTPEPTATSTPTPEPTATSTPTPEPTATSTPTPEPTSTNTPTPEATATSTPTAEPTEETEKTTAEPTVTQAVQQEEASSSNVESAAEWYQNPMIWIGGICILLIIILLIYHFIKKNK